MKAIVNTGPGKLEWLEQPMPEPKAGQVRIRVAACGVCATDLEMIDGWSRTAFPAIPGHEWAGKVDATGPNVDASLVGQPCVGENVLEDGGEVGFEHPGGYGQYLITEAQNLQSLPTDYPLHQAVLIEPLAVCVRGLRRLRLEDHSAAVVLGDGPIGLLMVMLLKAQRVQHVVLVGGRPARLELARELGADAVANYHEHDDDAGMAAVEAGCGPYFPNVIEASGSPTAVNQSLRVAAHQARVLILGDYGHGRADFAWNRVLHGELEIIGSNASAAAWPEAVRVATSGQLPLGKLVSARVPAAHFARAIDLARNNREGVKVVLEWVERG